MAVFFNLCGKRAAAGAATAACGLVDCALQHSLSQARPVDSRIFTGIARVKQFAVFNKNKAFDDNFRYGLKTRINMGRVGHVKKRLTAAVIDFKPRLRLFMIGRVNAQIAELNKIRRKARLGLNIIASFAGALDEGGKINIAAPLVRRPGLGIAYGIACAGRHLESKLLRKG